MARKGRFVNLSVTICPEFDAFWYSCYVQGIRELFPPARRRFSMRPFPPCDNPVHFRCIVHGERDLRCFIDAKDNPRYDQRGLEWCDVYAKVNLRNDDAPSPKVISAGPNFPMKLERLAGTAVRSLALFGLRTAARRQCSRTYARMHFAGWHSQWRYAERESDYSYQPSNKSYVFFASSLWKNEAEANEIRASFIRICRSLRGVRFEGGFAPRSAGDVPGFDDLTTARRYSHREFVEKSARSLVVLNNPAVARSHSWRLAEFLALGKAIISTTLDCAVPAPLVHGEHIHYAGPAHESLRAAIEQIIDDPAYRTRLERGARDYYERFLSPRAVMSRLLLRTNASARAAEAIPEELAK